MTTPGGIVSADDAILVTGAAGFIGKRVVANLVQRDFRNVRCLVRRADDAQVVRDALPARMSAHLDVVTGNLLSRDDCARLADGVTVIYHLAAGRGDMFGDVFMNSVVTTRNLLDAALASPRLRRFVHVSSLSVYSNRDHVRRRVLDERCPLESEPARRGDPYTYGKAKQEEMVVEYGRRTGLPWVILRPGTVYGPGNDTITNRVGISTFGVFLHLGGANRIPLTYVDNCADAIVLAGLTPGVEGEAFNVVDDDLPSSRTFLRLYKRHVRRFRSIYVPHAVSYVLSCLWERYSSWSEGQLPPVYNARSWHAFYKKTRYTNTKLKTRLGWRPTVPPDLALRRYFESCRMKAGHA